MEDSVLKTIHVNGPSWRSVMQNSDQFAGIK